MKSKIIRRLAIMVMLELIIIVICSTSCMAESENFTISSDKTTVDIDDTIDINLNLTDGLENKNQLTVIVKYDSSKLEIIPDTKNTDGDKLLVEGESLYNDILSSEDGIILGFINDDDSLSIVYYTNSEENYLATSANLAKLKFKAIKSGSAQISFETIEYAYENEEPIEVKSCSELTIKVNEKVKKGDINGDGKVTLLDYGLVLAHVKRTKLLTGDMLERADVNGDNKVTLLDYGLILAHVKRTKLLF